MLFVHFFRCLHCRKSETIRKHPKKHPSTQPRASTTSPPSTSCLTCPHHGPSPNSHDAGARRVRQVRGIATSVPGQVRVTGALSLTCQRDVLPRPRLTFIRHLSPHESVYFFSLSNVSCPWPGVGIHLIRDICLFCLVFIIREES